jgi:hypothetical protein
MSSAGFSVILFDNAGLGNGFCLRTKQLALQQLRSERTNSGIFGQAPKATDESKQVLKNNFGSKNSSDRLLSLI